MPTGMFMWVNLGMANPTDKESLPLPMGVFMLVNLGMTNTTEEEPLPLLTVESLVESGATMS